MILEGPSVCNSMTHVTAEDHLFGPMDTNARTGKRQEGRRTGKHVLRPYGRDVLNDNELRLLMFAGGNPLNRGRIFSTP